MKHSIKAKESSPPANELAVRGVALDAQSRCAHWRGPTDIVAIKFFCCKTYYACHACHAELAGHTAAVWPRGRFTENAVLCGACALEMSIRTYLAACPPRCPGCRAAFNPRCRLHHDFYFAGCNPASKLAP